MEPLRPRTLLLLYSLCLCHVLRTVAMDENLSNVALNKPATQSSVYGQLSNSQNAVDGKKATRIQNCFHTKSYVPGKNEQWWRVDLEGFFKIYAVVITNRGDCCASRLAKFDVEVARSLDQPKRSAQDPGVRSLCLRREKPINSGATVRLNCKTPVVGRYVTVAFYNPKSYLHFCEIEVLAKPALLVSRNTQCVKRANQRAPRDRIKETYSKSVTQCVITCAMEPKCSAVNIQTDNAATGRGKRLLCELMAYGGPNHPSKVNPASGWNFYLLNYKNNTYKINNG